MSYSPLEKLLHHLALNYTSILHASFDIERKKINVQSNHDSHHVFVCGLARAGTTALMRSLYESDFFASLTYQDMPFVMAPNLWSKITKKSKKTLRKGERVHGDGVIVNEKSPEALEEVFWRMAQGSDYVQHAALVPMIAQPETQDDFREYVALILHRYGKKRYLCKNNNNILRLTSIKSAFPHATIIIPYRDPVQQAISLHNQHQRFRNPDRFTRHYMRWLVHYEFGIDHRPFHLDNKEKIYKNPDDLHYWIEQWVHVYSYVLAQPKHLSLYFVGYENLCLKTEKTWAALCEKVALADVPAPKFSLRQSDSTVVIEPVLLKQARALYDALEARAFT